LRRQINACREAAPDNSFNLERWFACLEFRYETAPDTSQIGKDLLIQSQPLTGRAHNFPQVRHALYGMSGTFYSWAGFLTLVGYVAFLIRCGMVSGWLTD
jgi:hypothetical protein